MLSRFKGYKANGLNIKVVDYEPNSIALEVNYIHRVKIGYPDMIGNVYTEDGVSRYIPTVYILKPENVQKESFVLPDDFIKMTPDEVIHYYGVVVPVRQALNAKFRRGISKEEFTAMVNNAFRGFRQNSVFPRVMSHKTNPNKILIITPGVDPLDPRGRMPFIKINDPAIDMASISISGGNAGLIAEVKKNGWSATLENAIAHRHTRKLIGCRTNFENSLPLVKPEKPMVLGFSNNLSGVNLFTAVMTGRYNRFDAVEISETAAKKLAAVKSFVTRIPAFFDICVEEGDEVPAKAIIAKFGDQTIRTRCPYPARVDEISVVGNTVAVTLQAAYPFTTGDKIFTRTGNKSIGKVVPDSEMPLAKLPDGREIRVDVLVDPVGLLDRRNYAFLLEMAATMSGIKRLKDKIDIAPCNVQAEVEYMGRKIENVTVGYVYFIRIDKNAVELTGTKPNPESKFYTIKDSTLAGARVNLTNMLVMTEKHPPKDIVNWIAKYRELQYVDDLIKLVTQKGGQA